MVGQPPPAGPGDGPTAWFRIVSAGFFDAIGMRLESGRFIEPTDTAATGLVVVVNRALVNRYFGGAHPVGRSLAMGPERTLQVIGVVGDVRHRGLDADPLPQLYLSDQQFPRRQMTLVVEAAGEPSVLSPAIRAAVAAEDPALPVSSIQTMESLIAGSLATPRLLSAVMLMFAGAALLLTVASVSSAPSPVPCCSARSRCPR